MALISTELKSSLQEKHIDLISVDNYLTLAKTVDKLIGKITNFKCFFHLALYVRLFFRVLGSNSIPFEKRYSGQHFKTDQLAMSEPQCQSIKRSDIARQVWKRERRSSVAKQASGQSTHA